MGLQPFYRHRLPRPCSSPLSTHHQHQRLHNNTLLKLAYHCILSLAVVTRPTPAVAAPRAAEIMPNNPAMAALAASKDAVVDVVVIHVDVLVVELLDDFGAVVPCGKLDI